MGKEDTPSFVKSKTPEGGRAAKRAPKTAGVKEVNRFAPDIVYPLVGNVGMPKEDDIRLTLGGERRQPVKRELDGCGVPMQQQKAVSAESEEKLLLPWGTEAGEGGIAVAADGVKRHDRTARKDCLHLAKPIPEKEKGVGGAAAGKELTKRPLGSVRVRSHKKFYHISILSRAKSGAYTANTIKIEVTAMQFDENMMKALLSESDEALWRTIRAVAARNNVTLPAGQPSAADMARLRAILGTKGPADVEDAMRTLRRVRGESKEG